MRLPAPVHIPRRALRKLDRLGLEKHFNGEVDGMPYSVYKLIHFLGIFALLITLTAACMHVLRGGTRADNPHRRTLGAVHGIAVFLILLGGFGMLARLGIVQGGLPTWIWLKLVIWVMLGFALMVIYRGVRFARPLMIAVPLFALLAAAIALYKPF